MSAVEVHEADLPALRDALDMYAAMQRWWLAARLTTGPERDLAQLRLGSFTRIRKAAEAARRRQPAGGTAPAPELNLDSEDLADGANVAAWAANRHGQVTYLTDEHGPIAKITPMTREDTP